MMSHVTTVSSRPPHNRRSAYTLIEMLIASVLVAALMSVVWTMMSMYNGYLKAGQSQAVEQQLIRSLLLLLEDDLQSVALPDINPVVTASFDTIGASDGELTGVAPNETQLDSVPQVDPFSIDDEAISLFTDAAKSKNGAALGRISLLGNSHSVRLSIEVVAPDSLPVAANPEGPVEQPSTEFGTEPLSPAAASDTMQSSDDQPAIEGIAPDVPEFRTIIWQFEPVGVTSSGPSSLSSGLYRIETESHALQTALGQQETLVEDAGQNDDMSVDRMTLEALLFPPMDNRREESQAMSTADNEFVNSVPQFDVIPEVVGCRFEYFSGSAWKSSWNSEQQQSLPLAVRIRLHLVASDKLEKLKLAFGDSQGADTLLDSALSDATNTNGSSPVSPMDGDTAADPFTSIPTRQIERIVILQPLTGPMPQPGNLDDTDSAPINDNPPLQEGFL
jgi:prepilin-type N-terminal cleavage/methylation domain-containing protein